MPREFSGRAADRGPSFFRNVVNMRAKLGGMRPDWMIALRKVA